jgi:hypothetical protein
MICGRRGKNLYLKLNDLQHDLLVRKRTLRATCLMKYHSYEMLMIKHP